MADIIGTEGADKLVGTASDDLIDALGGNDRVEAGNGNDIVDGGAGDDLIYGGQGADKLYGGIGQDDLYDGHGNDLVDGGEGDDSIFSSETGSDTLLGGAGNDSILVSHTGTATRETLLIDAGAGDDQVELRYSYSRGSLTVHLGDGADQLTLGPTNSDAIRIELGDGRDRVKLEAFATFSQTHPGFTDFATGPSGDVLDLDHYLTHSITNWDGSNPFGARRYMRLVQQDTTVVLQLDRDGAAGSTYDFKTLVSFENSLVGAFSAENFNGMSPDGSNLPSQTITGTEGVDDLIGTGGDDLIDALGSGDRVEAGSGDDTVFGGAGMDTIYGGVGADKLYGGLDDDTLWGGQGNDLLDGGDGDDVLSDHDTGSDTLRGGAGNDYLSLDRGYSTIEQTSLIDAGIGDDVVDFLSGSSPGLTTIDLGDGADKLTLGTNRGGEARITLGPGQDLLTFVPYADVSTKAPVVTDFATGETGDVVDIIDFLTMNLIGWDGSNAFGPAGYLRLVQPGGAHTHLLMNRNGAAGAQDFSILLTFENTTLGSFTAANFNGMAPDGSVAPPRTFDGTEGSDTLTGTFGDDLINGLGGNDDVKGGGGNDIIHGGAGNDQIKGGPGGDSLYGGANGDVLEGGHGSDFVDGGDGSDYIFEHDSGSDTLVGGAGNDIISFFHNHNGSTEAILIDAGIGDDQVDHSHNSNNGTLSIDLGEGADRLTFGGASYESMRITLGSGVDRVTIGRHASYSGSAPIFTDFATGAGGDVLDLSAYLPSRLINWDGSNPFGPGRYLRLVQNGSTVYLQVDRDGAAASTFSFSTLLAFEKTSVDKFTAANFDGLSPQWIYGTAGADALIGSSQADHLFGLAGADRLSGLEESDMLDGGAGDDMLDGGTGVDTATFSGLRSAYGVTNLGGGQFRVTGPDGADQLMGIERLQFTNGTYAAPSAVYASGTSLVAPVFGAGAAAGGWSDDTIYPRTLGDINGDGKLDLVGFGHAGIYVALATGSGTFGGMYLSKNIFGAGIEAGGWSDANTYPRMLADMNGDGRHDLVGFGHAGVYAALATGNGSFGDIYLAKNAFGAGTEAGGWSNDSTYPRMLGDVNGDGKADLIGFGYSGVYVALGTGTGTFGDAYLATGAFGAGPESGGWSDTNTYPRMLADVNGDGRDDLVGFGYAGVYAALAAPNGTFGTIYLAKDAFGAGPAAGGWTNDDRYPRLVADMNGDDRADIVGFGHAGVYVAAGQANGTFGDIFADLGEFGAGAGGWESNNLFPRHLADVNGDGLADIVGFASNGVQVALATDLILIA